MTVSKALALTPARSGTRALRRVALAAWLIGAIAICLALQAYLAFVRQINWDEFYFLTHVYEYRRGELNSVLQTFYVHLFTWLPLVSVNTINQIVFARLLMLTLETGTLGLIYYSARQFASREAALLGVLSYASFIYVFVHGASFRADPIATFLLMTGIALFLAPGFSWKHAALGASAVAIAGLITIKAAFYLPVFAAIALYRLSQSNNRRPVWLALGIGAVLSTALFAVLYMMHRASLAPPDHASTTATATGDFDAVFAAGAFQRTSGYLLAATLDGPITFASILLGLGFCIWNIFRAPATRAQSFMLLAFAFPLATIFFYRNSFPYYYTFVLAPAAVLAAVAFEQATWLRARAIWAAGFVVCLLWQTPSVMASDQSVQRATLDAVYAMFPKPVAHIGRCGMVSDYPRVGFFMSSWGIEAYRAAGKPVLRDAIINAEPRFVLANTPVLQNAFDPASADVPAEYRLLDADIQALRDNYVHQWGDIWVAGKNIRNLSGSGNRSVTVWIEGVYTIESPAPIIVDGVAHKPGSIVQLKKGAHLFRSARNTQNVVLRWGDHLARPAKPAPQAPIFDGF